MSIRRTFHCDGPDCERHVETRHDQPPIFLTVTEHDGEAKVSAEMHYCGWDCVLRYAGRMEPETVISGSPSDDSF